MSFLPEETSETRALIERLRSDAKYTHAQADSFESNAKAMLERSARKRQQAYVWERAASRLETMLVNDELQEPMAANEGNGDDNVSTSANLGR